MKLTAADRKKIPANDFAMPGKRKWPINDRSPAANAKARATQGVEKGTLSPAMASKIRAKANRLLGGK